MIHLTTSLSTPISFPVDSADADRYYLLDGEVVQISEKSKALSDKVSVVTISPNQTGEIFVLTDTSVVAHISVVDAKLDQLVKDIHDGLLGSWSWDKVKGTLKLYRQSGEVLNEYVLQDTSDDASRELGG